MIDILFHIVHFLLKTNLVPPFIAITLAEATVNHSQKSMENRKVKSIQTGPGHDAGVPQSGKRLPIPPVTFFFFFFFFKSGAINSLEILWMIQIHAVSGSALPNVSIESKNMAGIP